MTTHWYSCPAVTAGQVKGPAQCHMPSSFHWLTAKTLEVPHWVGAFMVGMPLVTWRRLHPSITSTLEKKASPCQDALCPGAAGFLVSHLTSQGHGGTAARRARGVIPPNPSCCGVEKGWGSPSRCFQLGLRGAREACYLCTCHVFVSAPCWEGLTGAAERLSKIFQNT